VEPEELFVPTAEERLTPAARRSAPEELSEESTNDATAAWDEAANGWVLRWTFAEQAGQLVVRSLAIEPAGRTTPGGGLTGAVLRQRSPARVATLATSAWARARSENTFAALLLRWRKAELDDNGSPSTPRRPGRPRLPDDLLAEVATAYLEEMERGPGVLRRVGERLGRPESTVRDWVHIARREGFLTPARKTGSRGAAPGPRLIARREDQ
jgi:hypothetical protein